MKILPSCLYRLLLFTGFHSSEVAHVIQFVRSGAVDTYSYYTGEINCAILIFRKFVDIFGSQSEFKTARHLMKELEIPDFNFIRHEIILGLIPYLSLIGLIFLNDLRSFTLAK